MSQNDECRHGEREGRQETRGSDSKGCQETDHMFTPPPLKGNSGAEGSCEMTEKRIFSMAEQVASALVG